ncbi:AI-2E family transporter [Gellertiella hungarica]|uniref:Putative PurR-regulated permease PerM n=1 Tax=Gellertiella hungarica TaxID=1572859 RepID=A0A7W6NKY2_9HYPH|nr:AI-2E family transporter [Gellertiella hungarica]MBB4065960.1 putative PurR-regulated permease PerM [Gellertiella hungarica]
MRARSHPYIVGIFVILVVNCLYLGKEFLTPVLLAFLLSTTLAPVVRTMTKWGIPPAIGATLLIALSAFVFLLLGYITSGPIAAMIADAPQIGYTLKLKLIGLKQSLEGALEATSQIENVTSDINDTNAQKVVVAQPGILSRAAGNLLSIGTTVAITFVLSLFLLASGNLFYQKIVQSFSRLSDKKKVLRIVYSIEGEISRYLLTITVINIMVGIFVGTGLWLIGISNPLVWGVLAFLLNYLPYIGALISIVLVGIMSIVTFDNVFYSLLAPGLIVFSHVAEGQFLTPMLIGRRMELNAVAVFISISFWSWLWGFIGALMAVPILVVIKVIADHVESWRPLGNFLSGEHPTISESPTQPQRD